MKVSCHWRDCPYRASKALRSRLYSRFPRLGEAAVQRRFRGHPGFEDARARVLGAADLALWPRDDGPRAVPDAATRQRIAREAARIRRHEFDILGSGPVDHGHLIRWHLDAKSGHEWPADIPWRAARRLTPEGVDLKMPWELSRCHQFVTLAVAWRLERDARNLDEFRAQLMHWIETNPYPLGVNWACPMDGAIRLVNWITALGIFKEAISELEPRDGFFQRIDRAIWDHGWHLARHLEASGPRCPRGGNHLYADLCGLLAAGLYFDGCRAGLRWLAMARAGIEVQTLGQFLDDGGPGESSTPYHRLLLEMALWSEAQLVRTDSPLADPARRRIRQALGFVRDTCDPAGNSPNIGDNDSGRLLVLVRDGEGIHDYLWKADSMGMGRAHRMLLTGDDRAADLPSARTSYPVSGFHLLRSPRWHLCVRAGRIGRDGVHAHCDQLSFVASIGGVPFLVDPGSYLYTSDPDSRNRFRSGGSHNIARPVRMDQNLLGEGRAGVFVMRTRREACVTCHEPGPNGGRLSGRFDYGEGSHRIEWVRTFELEGMRFLVRDAFGTEGDETIRWGFHFASGVEIEWAEDGLRASTKGGEVRVRWSDGMEALLRTAFHSGGYGEKVGIEVLELQREKSGGEALACAIEFSLISGS